MRGHAFTDIKMIMGLDYMGRWASFQVYLGMEPDAAPEMKQWQLPKDASIALAVGAVALVLGLGINQGFLLGIGALALGYGIYRWQSSKKVFLAQRAAEEIQAQAKKVRERFYRNYKIDDMRLFCTAMKSVYKRVIDDIVERGAKVVRIEGGQGGYFSGSEAQVPAPTGRVSNAAESAV